MPDVIIGNSAASATSVAASRLVPASEPIPQVSVSTASLPVAAHTAALTTPTPVSSQNFASSLQQNIQPNPLNQYWQPTYHFKFFMAGDADLLSTTSATTITQLLGNVNNSLNQVVIAESGRTGYNIREVEITTIPSQNGLTREQHATTMTMTITEPLGVSFLDALAGAGVMLGVKDYTKMIYFLQLTFTGYNPDGTFAGNPIPIGGSANSNGGRWLWAVRITTIDVKINEGAGVYTLNCVVTETASAVMETEYFAAKEAIVAQGATLGDVLNDYAAKLTRAYAADLGKDSKGNPLLSFKIDATHPIDYGDTQGVKPASFAMAPKNVDLGNIRNKPLPAGSQYQISAPAGMTANDFIAMAIKNTAQGQAYIKDVNIPDNTDINAKQTTPQGFRLSVFFSIEADIKVIDWDSATGNYVKQITLHIIPCFSQTSILSRPQVVQAQTPSSQRAMINDILKRGMLRKEYDYLFTGLNTEVIDFNIEFNLPWQAELAKQEGARMSHLNVAVNAKQNLAPGFMPTVLQPDQLSAPATITPPQQAINTVTPPATPPSMVGSQISGLTHTVAANSAKVFYMEDVLSSFNQAKVPTVMPVSFYTGLHDIEHDAGQIGSGAVQSSTRDQPLAGAVISQKMYGAFMTIELNIRGDPYWLGQTNVERQVILRTGGNVNDASKPPSYTNGNPMFILKFLYPSQLGDDFKPVLKNSLVFNGVYEVVKAVHTFSEGAFKTKLDAKRMVLLDLNLANTTDPNSTVTSETSSGTATASDGTVGSGSTPGSGTSTIAPTGSLPPSQNQQQLAQSSYNFWVANGYSPAGASAMVSQEEAESAFGTNPNTSTNPSVAAGNFQWSPTRQAQILAGTGIDVSTASHDQQLQAALWEQTQGGFKSVGSQLQTSTDPGAAGVLATQKYEIPAALQTQSQIRGGRAAFWNSNFTNTSPIANNGAPI